MTQQPPNTNPLSAPTPTRPPQTTVLTPSKSINVNNLGYYLDGWADLIEGMGEKDNEVQTRVLEGLKERKMPGIYPSYISTFAVTRYSQHFNN